MTLMHRCLRRFADSKLQKDLTAMYAYKAQLDQVHGKLVEYGTSVRQFGLSTGIELSQIAVDLTRNKPDDALARVLALRDRVTKDTESLSLSDLEKKNAR